MHVLKDGDDTGSDVACDCCCWHTWVVCICGLQEDADAALTFKRVTLVDLGFMLC
jgi:hypothetical protein